MSVELHLDPMLGFGLFQNIVPSQFGEQQQNQFDEGDYMGFDSVQMCQVLIGGIEFDPLPYSSQNFAEKYQIGILVEQKAQGDDKLGI